MVFERMRRQVKWIVLAVAVAFAVTLLYVGGPGLFSRRPAQPPVARVNGEAIDQETFQQAVASQLRALEQTRGAVRPSEMDEVRYQALNRLVHTRLLLQAARDEGIRVERREVDRRLREIRDAFPSEREYRRELERSQLTERDLRRAVEEGLLIEKLRERVTAGVTVSDDEVARAYEQVRLRQILVRPRDSSAASWKQAEERAQALYRRLQSGADFASLARAESDDTATRERGGELGLVGRNLLPEALEKAVFDLKAGQISPPVRSEVGFHILQVTERREAKGKAFEEAREQLREQLLSEKQDVAFARWFDDLRRQAAVEVLEPRLAARDALGRGDLKQALAQYEKALQTDSQDPYLHYAMARVLAALQKQDEALSHLVRAVELEATDPVLHLELGNAYRQKGQREQAVAAFRKASQLAPMDLQMHLMLYAIFSDMGLKEDALNEQRELEKIQQVLEQQRRLQEELARRLQQSGQQPGQSQGQSQGQGPGQGQGAAQQPQGGQSPPGAAAGSSGQSR